MLGALTALAESAGDGGRVARAANNSAARRAWAARRPSPADAASKGERDPQG